MADYASLQKLALEDKGQDEAVTVNQRALIGTVPSSFPNKQIKSSLAMLLTTQHCGNCSRTRTTRTPLMLKSTT
jgi:hypothetical protein